MNNDSIYAEDFAIVTWGDGTAVDDDVLTMLCDADSHALGNRDNRHGAPISIARQWAYITVQR